MENRRVSMNRHTNLLQLEEHMYPLVDVATPNVFRNLFPYSEVPKIAFNDRVVPHHMPDDIWITFISWADRKEGSVLLNFSFTVRKTVMLLRNVWREAMSSLRLPAGSVQIRRTSSLSAIWV